MKFNNIKDMYAHYFAYEPYLYEYDEKNTYLNLVDKPVMGDWLLFKHIIPEKNQISKPILALIIGHTFWDMALVLEYVTETRAFEYNSQIYNEITDQYRFYFEYSGKEIQYIQFWTDDIEILGHWKNKPSFKEIKFSLNNKI